jgi:hypothetical protein
MGKRAEQTVVHRQALHVCLPICLANEAWLCQRKGDHRCGRNFGLPRLYFLTNSKAWVLFNESRVHLLVTRIIKIRSIETLKCHFALNNCTLSLFEPKIKEKRYSLQERTDMRLSLC